MSATSLRRIEGTRDGEGADQYFDTDGHRVRYRVRGEGPPLLMLHGIGAPLEYWSRFEQSLDGVCTIMVDPPGSGRSSSPGLGFGMRQHAQVLAKLIDHLGRESVSVLGLSLGGMMAQELAHRSPERVHKLILASTTCGLGSIPASPRVLAAIASPLRFYSRRHYEHIAPLMYGDQIADDRSILDEHMAIRRRIKPSLRGHFAQLRAACSWTSRPWLGRLAMPVLVIAGSEDRVVPVGNARMLAFGVQDGMLEVLEGGSHLCLIQRPEVTVPVIMDFLTEG